MGARKTHRNDVEGERVMKRDYVRFFEKLELYHSFCLNTLIIGSTFWCSL